jgi:hypothetical protein
MVAFNLIFTLVMLFSIGLRLLLPVFNAHSVELDPGHTHIVIGAKNEQEVTDALMAHQHAIDPQHIENRPSTSSRRPGSVWVVNVAAPHDGASAVLAFEGQSLFVSVLRPLIVPPDGLWHKLSDSSIIPGGILILPKDPPPRPSF